MNYFDLHCDTAQNFLYNKENADTCKGHISLKKAKKFEHYCQVFALFIHDRYRGEDAFKQYMALYKGIACQLKQFSDRLMQVTDISTLNAMEMSQKTGMILSVENGAALGGKLENIEKMASNGVKLFTLTWFGENELGFGSGTENRGLKPFGKEVLQKLNEYDIIPDISHLSDQGVYDVFKFTDKAVVATHSNARGVLPHFRNLTDDMIKELIKREGVVGLNLCEAFLKQEPAPASFEDIRMQIEYFWKLGAEDILCFGSDFDGAKVPDCIGDLNGMNALYVYLRKYGFPDTLLEKLFFQNARDFFYRQWEKRAGTKERNLGYELF